jgi:arabinogalactan endo-1,4-beta-galactosidase
MGSRRLALAGGLLAAVLAAAPASAHHRLTVNRALGASNTAATDGDAATTWCGTALNLDLGRARRITGAGLTLDKDATPTTARLQTSKNGRRWQTTRLAGTPGAPAYARLDGRISEARLTFPQPTCVGELRLFGPQRTRMALGADISFTRQEEQAGKVFTDNGRPGRVERILANHGANYIRLRLWVNPPAGYSDLANDLAMARRIKAAGERLYLDIHYSDFWADPQHQDTPAAWQGQDLSTLSNTVENYTRDTLRAFARQGTPVDMVSIGNEIRNGILWPVGYLDWSPQSWNALGTLLKAGVKGAKEADRHVRIMLHYDQGGDNGGSRAFFDNIVAQHVPFDVIGLSYYPFWHGTVSALRNNLDDLATRYGKDVMIAEHQYAWTFDNGDTTNNFFWNDPTGDLLKNTRNYPVSPQGQISLANDILSALAAVPDHHGAGFFYWEPEWVPGVGWEPGAGTPNDNLTLFDFHAAALPSIRLFQDPVRAGDRG